MSQTCQKILKNKKKCKNKSKYTIYCTKHVDTAMNSIVTIQRWFRNIIYKTNIKNKGLSFYCRELCNNPCDFYTLDEIKIIPDKYFISYYDTQTKKIWGHDIRSLYMLFNENIYTNPYTTLMYPDDFLSRAKKYTQNIQRHDLVSFFYEYKNDRVDETEYIKRKAIDVFAGINRMGFFSSHEWLFSMSKYKLIKLYYDFKDIIYYRANLSDEQIFSIFGSYCPFDETQYLFNKKELYIVGIIIEKLEMILNNQNMVLKEQGILFFISVLTCVSDEAMETFPYISSL